MFPLSAKPLLGLPVPVSSIANFGAKVSISASEKQPSLSWFFISDKLGYLSLTFSILMYFLPLADKTIAASLAKSFKPRYFCVSIALCLPNLVFNSKAFSAIVLFLAPNISCFLASNAATLSCISFCACLESAEATSPVAPNPLICDL